LPKSEQTNPSTTYPWIHFVYSELAVYHATSRASQTPPAATYLITGEVAPLRPNRTYEDNEDIDMDYEEDMESEEEVPSVKNILVGENEVDGTMTLLYMWELLMMRCQGAKQKFTRIYSVIVYSLSPSPLRVRPYTSHCYSCLSGFKGCRSYMYTDGKPAPSG
jgi:hypothetical protein